MAKPETQTKTSITENKKVVKYSEKFGLDKDRKKLGVETNSKTVSPGKNFFIVKVVMTESKKRYDGADGETGEIIHGKKKIAQIDIITEDGTPLKFYAMNAPIVEACQNMLEDKDIQAGEDGVFKYPVLINEVVEGLGEQKRVYIAFQ
jgi:hypothetical protein